MAAPTIADFFGTTATVDTTDAANPFLKIPLDGLSVTGFTSTAKASNPESWLAAILKRARAYSAAASDELSSVVIDAPFLGITTRNSVAVREYSYSARIYEPDSGASEPDPDNI